MTKMNAKNTFKPNNADELWQNIETTQNQKIKVNEILIFKKGKI